MGNGSALEWSDLLQLRPVRCLVTSDAQRSSNCGRAEDIFTERGSRKVETVQGCAKEAAGAGKID